MSNRIYVNIWTEHFGPIPKDQEGRSLEIHHINGNHFDNRIENLKLVSIKEHFDIHHSQKDYAACHLIAKRMAKTPKELSKIVSNLNKKRIGKLNPFYGKRHTDEVKKIISFHNTGSNHPFWGIKRPEVGKKISKALKGVKKSKEHCLSLRKSKKGKGYKQYQWIIKHNNNEMKITNLKKFCRDNNIKPFSRFYSGKEINNYQKVKRYIPSMETL